MAMVAGEPMRSRVFRILSASIGSSGMGSSSSVSRSSASGDGATLRSLRFSRYRAAVSACQFQQGSHFEMIAADGPLIFEENKRRAFSLRAALPEWRGAGRHDRR